MQPASLSIIVPAYNAEATIARLVDSLAPLVDLPAHLILVDDGSTDGTADRAAATARGHGLPFSAIRQANAGPGPARNAGLDAAQGDTVLCIDADDTALADGVRALVQALAADTDAVAAVAPRLAITPDGRETPVATPIDADAPARALPLLRRVVPPIQLGSLLVRTELARRARFPALRIAEDFVYVARVLSQPGRVARVDPPSVRYADVPDRQTEREYRRRADLRAAAGLVLKGLPPYHPLRAHEASIEAAFEAMVARAALRLGDTRVGWRALMRARRLDPALPAARLRPLKVLRSLWRRAPGPQARTERPAGSESMAGSAGNGR